MSSSADAEPIDNNKQSKIPSTEGNEIVNEEEETVVVPGAFSDATVHSRGTRSQHRLLLCETETVNGIQERILANDDKKPEGVCRRYLGIFLALLSTFLFSVNQVGQKLLLKRFGPFNMAAWIFTVQFVATVPILLHYTLIKKKELLKSIRPFKSNRKTIILLGVRSLSDSGSFILFFVGLQYLDVGDAIVLISIAPVFVYILCRIFLKEPVGYVIIGTTLLAIGGVVVLAEPPGLYGGASQFDTKKATGIVFCLVACLTLSISLVIVRFMTHIFHGVLNILSYICGTGMALILAFSFKQQDIPHPHKSSFFRENDYFLIISVAVMTVAAQSLLVLSLHFEQAGQVALLRTIGVFFAFGWQVMVFQKELKITSVIGGAMIVTGVVVTILRKWMSTLPEDNYYRRKLAFLLK